jgi:reactive intermediate/imine deaminase
MATAAVAPAPAAAQAGAGLELEFLNPEGTQGNRPFSEAVRVGDFLYLSGKIGSVPGQGLAEGGIQAETRATLEAIKGALERYGSSMDRVFKCLVILADMAEFGAMNEVYVSYFPGDKPARSAFAASGLAAGARVEIECIAAVGGEAGG